MKLITYLIFFSLLFSSCQKKDTVLHWEAEITNSRYEKVEDIFKNNKNDIKSLAFNNDEKEIKKIKINLANNIASYFYQKKQVDIRKDFLDNPDGIIVLGLFMFFSETQNTKPSDKYNDKLSEEKLNSIPYPNDNFACFLTAISGFIGITEAKNIWNTIVSGSIETSTIIGGLKLMAKRVATVVTVGILIYEVGDCLGWWV